MKIKDLIRSAREFNRDNPPINDTPMEVLLQPIPQGIPTEDRRAFEILNWISETYPDVDSHDLLLELELAQQFVYVWEENVE